MGKVLSIAKLLLSIGPAIIGFMMELEKLFPEGGKGKEKLAALKAYVQGLWNTLGDAVPKFEEAWPKIEAIVAFVKNALKGTLFKKNNAVQ